MFLTEETFSTNIIRVRKHLDRIKGSGYIDGINKTSIYYEKYVNKNTNKVIVISHGFCENLIKLTELIYYFYKKGYSVYGIEHRGMGRSTHLGEDMTQVHVEKFDYYLLDMNKFINEIVKKDCPDKKIYLFGHSLGGLIATRYVQENPNDIEKLVLCSPFYGAKLKFPYWIVQMVSKAYIKAGREKKYVLIHDEYESYVEFENAHTTSKSRYEFAKSINEKYKHFCMAGGSYKWLSECLNAQKELFLPENMEKFKNKILLVSCGKDALVVTKKHNEFKTKMENCEVFKLPFSKHEPYFENDRIMKKFYNKVFEFLGE